MIKLVAFDWNGTLFADSNAVFEADLEVLKFLGKKPIKHADFLKHFEIPVNNYYRSLGVEPEILENKSDAMSEVFHKYYEPRVTKTRTRANTKTVLNWLNRKNIPAIIISNHIKNKIEEQLSRLKIRSYFKDVLANTTIGSVMKNKNKEEKIEQYLIAKKISPKEVLLVGDSLEEVEISKSIGTLSVAITDGNVSTKRLKAAKPDYLISTLGNLINIVREINS